jgi:hypothetical protein
MLTRVGAVHHLRVRHYGASGATNPRHFGKWLKSSWQFRDTDFY